MSILMRSRADAERTVGTFLGAALGDILGWPHEGRATRVGHEWIANPLSPSGWTKKSGGRFQPYEEQIEAGAYSDDTQLLIAVARSRLSAPNWWQHLAYVELPFWTTYERGGGGASLRASRLLLKGVLPWESGLGDQQKYFNAGGNGVAMRIAPHVIYHANQPTFDDLAAEILADGVLTHGHPRALLGALAYGYALWLALQHRGTLPYGDLVARLSADLPLWSEVPDISACWPTWRRAAENAPGFGSAWREAAEEMHHGLYVAMDALASGALAMDEETLREFGCFDRKINGAGTVAAQAALFLASKHAASPFEGVARAALARGADTDTIASMTGALAGAIAGVEWISTLLPQIQDHHYLAELAQRLAVHDVDSVQLRPLKPTALDQFYESLRRDLNKIALPIGGIAYVEPHDGVRSLSGRVHARAWKLRSDSGQSFVVKSIKVESPTRRVRESDDVPKLKLQPTSQPETKQAPPSSTMVGMALNVHDLSLSREFYAVLLGLHVSRTSEFRAQFGNALVLQQDRNSDSSPKPVTLYINVPDVERRRAEIIERLGIQVSAIVERGSRRSFTCRDPDGYCLEIFQGPLSGQ